jgi:hypothetical protein
MSIIHVGEATIHTQNHNLKLNHVLHVPQARKNLISVHRFTFDNNVFLDYHPYFFFIKDWTTRKLLLKGRCHKCLYPLPISCARHVLGVSRSSLHRWHSRLFSDACKSSSFSSHPLELVYSYVWGATPESVGRYKYYVSFINVFSKFTWVYLLKHKSEVFHKFQEFQTLVERLFDRKIISMQTNWGGEYEKLNPFFTK